MDRRVRCRRWPGSIHRLWAISGLSQADRPFQGSSPAHYRQHMRDSRRRGQIALLGLVLIGVLVEACAGPAASAPVASPSIGSGPTPAGPPPTILGSVTAGPVCPVERASPDPSCVPRPVSGAVIVITDAATGVEAARASTARDGSYAVVMPATGTFVVTALPVRGLMGTPAPVTITLSFPSEHERVDLTYDTGIR